MDQPCDQAVDTANLIREESFHFGWNDTRFANHIHDACVAYHKAQINADAADLEAVRKERDEAQGTLETACRYLKDYQGGGTPEDVIEACKELASAYQLISDIDTKGETEGADDIAQVIDWLHSWLVEARRHASDAIHDTVELRQINDRNAKETARLRADLEAVKRERDEARAEASRCPNPLFGWLPQTYGEAVLEKWIQHGDCEPHEWDNRTTAENAKWMIEKLRDHLESERAAHEKTSEYEQQSRSRAEGIERLCTEVTEKYRKAEADLEAVRKERDGVMANNTWFANEMNRITAQNGELRDESVRLESDLAAARKRIEVLEGRILDYCERNGWMRGALMEALRANIALPFGLRKQFEKALSTQSESEATPEQPA